MKHIKSFDEFVNEGIILEKKELSPANTKLYNWNKTSVNALKKWTFKLKDLTATFNDWEYYGNNSSAADFLSGKYKSYGLNHLSFNIGGIVIKISITRKDNKLEFETEPSYNSMYFDIKELQYLQYIDENEDKILGFIELLNFLFMTYENEIFEFVNGKLSLPTLYVIKAGEIAPATGKNGHGWSIYDHKDSILGMTKSGMTLMSANGFKVGDKFKILDDQTHKLIANEVEIVALVPATYKDFVAYSRQRGADVPVGAFQKQSGTFRFTLYAIK